MTYLIVLFNLRVGVTEERYEEWAKTVDMPGVRRLNAVKSFDVFRASGTFSGDPAPYRYVEVLEIDSLDALKEETQNEINRSIAATFQGELADRPVFMICDKLD